ncbi:hypothetical protein C3L33_19428, partial [Rhododendron williamsianum]
MGCVYSKSCIGDICTPKEVRVKERVNVRAAEFPVFSPDSSDGGAEHGDEFNEHGGNRDCEVGITRLSRVSGQFLPPEGSRTVKVPSGNYELRYSYLSQRGYYPDALDKANQDSFCIHTPFGTNADDLFFGVFDGHGEFGAQCSQFVKRKLCENLLRNSRFRTDAVEACHAAFLATNSQLHADSLDDSMSGTTAITILVRGRTLYIANSGDSRAVIAERKGNGIVAIDLSIDQTPFRADELERVKLCGARVLTLDQIEGLKSTDVQCWGTEEADDGDPPRLWVENGMYPGTAFTRSLGDSIAESIGVVANPEIVVLELTQDHPFFVIASDGVFEFLSSQAVVDMVAKYKDPRDACAAIVAESYRLWLQYETRTDDITVIVVHTNGLTNTSVSQAASPSAVLHPPVPQIVEATGSESPSALSWSSRFNRARHDLSRARLRVIESSLENGQLWVPPSPAHRKTWEEEGGEGDCFYVVGSGEFEVLATQEEKDTEVPRVLHRYTAEKLSSFGELALIVFLGYVSHRYNKPLQASVRAVTSGTLWALRREDFRGILMSEFSNLTSLKLLRSVDLLSRLTILQLSHIADSLSELPFSDGQTIANRDEALLGLYIIQKGTVKIFADQEVINKPNTGSLKSNKSSQDNEIQSNKELLVEKNEGSYFGEWTLLGEPIGSVSAVAVGDVLCAVLTKEKFDSIVGPLAKLSQEDHKPRDYTLNLSKESEGIDPSTLGKVNISDLEWRTCLYSTDCSEIGLVVLRDSGSLLFRILRTKVTLSWTLCGEGLDAEKYLLSLKRFSKHKIRSLGKESVVLKEKNLMKSINSSAGVPQILCTCADQTYAGILLNTRIACSLSSILHTPLDEASARFCAASVVTALQDLHKNEVLYRGVSSDVLMFDQEGHLQLVDFRFGKKLSGERTFTICGMADSLAPEIVQGKGHGLPADWSVELLALNLCIAKDQTSGPSTCTKTAAGKPDLANDILSDQTWLEYGPLVTSRYKCLEPATVGNIAGFLKLRTGENSTLLEVDESTRLGSQGAHSVKTHPWFHGVDWEGVTNGSFPVPHEITSRIAQHLETHSEDFGASPSPNPYVEQLNTPEWLEDW